MNKIIFYNINKQIISSNYNNLYINYGNISNGSIVLNLRETDIEKEYFKTGQYSHIIKHNNNYKLYYRINRQPNFFSADSVHFLSVIAYAEYINNKFIKSNLNIHNNINNGILDNQGASHNFYVFIDKNNKLKAIGGICVGPHKYSKNKTKLKLYKYNNNICFNRWYKNIYDPYVNMKEKLNGLYLFESDNGIKWELVEQKPIFHSLIKSLYINNEVIDFDTQPQIIYHNNKYILYTRANIKNGVRNIIYSLSTDLLNWTEPKYINYDFKFDLNHDNLYYIGIYKYPNSQYLIAFPSYFYSTQLRKNEVNKSCIYILLSIDGINWFKIREIFNHDKIMYKYNIAGFYNNELFIHKNVHTFNNYINKYIIREDSLCYLTSNNNKINFFSLQKKYYFNKLFLNFETFENGYVIIFLDNNIFSHKLIGNYTNLKIFDIDKFDYNINIEICNSNLYSIIYN